MVQSNSRTSVSSTTAASTASSSNSGQKRPQPSAAGQFSCSVSLPSSLTPLQQQLLLGNSSSALSLQHPAATALFTLADANLFQQQAAVTQQHFLVNNLQAAAAAAVLAQQQQHNQQQQQEIAAKRIRFACPQLLPIISSAPALIPVNCSLPGGGSSQSSLLQQLSNAANSATNNNNILLSSSASALSSSSNAQQKVQQQQQMAAQLSSFHHQQVAGIAAGIPGPAVPGMVTGGANLSSVTKELSVGITASNGSMAIGNGANSGSPSVVIGPVELVVDSGGVLSSGAGIGGGTVGDFGGRFEGNNKNKFMGTNSLAADSSNGGGGTIVGLNHHHSSSMNGGSISQSYQDLTTGVQHQPNSILRIIIDCMLYPVTLDVLYMIFSRYGKVLRIITFSKNNSFQALIQLSESSAAQNAKNSLDGLNIYNGCCTLRIEFSKLNTLNVKYNNDKSRDYTNPNLPSGELTYEQKLQLILQNAAIAQQQQQMGGGGAGGGQLGPLIPFSAAAVAAAAAANASQFPFNAGAMALQQQNNDLLASAAAAGQVLPNNLTGIVLNTAQYHQNGVNTSVVLVSNLDEATVTPEQLFILFGVYGDVLRVKILFNKKDNALIQYSDVQQAQLAIQHLDKVKWNGRNMRVTASKHNVVQMPKEGQPDAGLTKEFSNSSLHRFKKPGSKNYMNIYPPSSTLHLSNIPGGMTDEQMLEIFKDHKLVEFKFFQKDHKMALVQMEDIEQAVSFLIAMHNYKLADNAHLRVSFSKKGING